MRPTDHESAHFLPADQEQFGESGLNLFRGHVWETVDLTTGDVAALPYRGTIEDACALLT